MEVLARKNKAGLFIWMLICAAFAFLSTPLAIYLLVNGIKEIEIFAIGRALVILLLVVFSLIAFVILLRRYVKMPDVVVQDDGENICLPEGKFPWESVTSVTCLYASGRHWYEAVATGLELKIDGKIYTYDSVAESKKAQEAIMERMLRAARKQSDK